MHDEQIQFRSSVIKQMLVAVDAHPRSHEILAAISPSIVESVRAASRADLVRAQDSLEIWRGAFRVGGRELTIELAKQGTISSAGIPLLRPLVRGALAIFGDGPHTLIGLMPRAMQASSPNFRDLEVERLGPTRARLVYRNLPPVFRDPVWYLGQIGSLLGICELAGARGRVEIEDANASDGIVAFVVDWG